MIDAAFPVVRLRASASALLVGTLLVLAGAAARAAEDDDPSVVPYRPSVSTPAALSAPGYLELELGGLALRGAGSQRRYSAPYGVKLAFSPDWGIRVGGETWVRQTDDSGARLQGFGDTGFVLKRRFEVNDASAFGLEIGATLPTGRTGIGADGTAYSLNGIYSADIGSWHTDLNLLAARAGGADPGTSRTQSSWAASLSRALDDRIGVAGELSGTHQRGATGTSQFLFAGSYNVSKKLVLDAGFARSLRSGVSDTSFFAGVTILGPRLF